MPQTRLDDQLCFALYAASRAVISAQRPGLRELGLTYSQYIVMLVLWEEGSATVGRLCERVQLDSGTVSPVVRRLDTAGLVQRKRSVDDERSVVVELTSAGIELGEKADCVTAALADAVDALAADADYQPAFAVEELIGLRTALHQLTDELRRFQALNSATLNSTSINATGGAA